MAALNIRFTILLEIEQFGEGFQPRPQRLLPFDLNVGEKKRWDRGCKVSTLLMKG